MSEVPIGVVSYSSDVDRPHGIDPLIERLGRDQPATPGTTLAPATGSMPTMICGCHGWKVLVENPRVRHPRVSFEQATLGAISHLTRSHLTGTRPLARSDQDPQTGEHTADQTTSTACRLDRLAVGCKSRLFAAAYEIACSLVRHEVVEV